MYTPVEPTKDIERLNTQSKEIAARLAAAVVPTKTGVRLLADQPVFNGASPRESFFFIREGGLSYVREGKQLFIYDEGDFIGFESLYFPGDGTISSDFSVIADEYRAADFLAAVRQDVALFDLWMSFLATQHSLLVALMSALKACEVALQPEIRTYAPGETIILEGSDGEEVFTMVDGRANVFVRDVQVGEIGGDEIFGALAVLTNTPRIASVVATEHSMVLVLKRDQFVDLIQNKPLTVLKMVEDMAKSIISLNHQVVGLSAGKVV